MHFRLLGSALLSVPIIGLLATGQVAVPADQEPHHHVVLKNEYIEVIRATLAPGEFTGYHTHASDGAGVELSDDTTAEQFLGEPEGKPSPARIGDVWAEPLPHGNPYTHRVHNVGSTRMDLIDLVFLQKPSQAPVSPAATVAAENAEVRVYKWVLAAGASTAMHTHEKPYLIVAVTPMHLKMSAPDGRSLSEEVKPGDFHWIDSKVTHALANDGTTESTIVEFELK